MNRTEAPPTEDKPAQPVRQPYTDREQTIIHLHGECAFELGELRAERDELNAKIRDLVPVEDRLRRMVHIIERAYEDGDDAPEAD